MNNLIELTINQYNMVDYGDTVIVALSGGTDSVCLLHNLVLLKDKYNLKVMACHLNHHLRGEESNSDMEFCKELCRQNNIELFVKEVDVDKLSNELVGAFSITINLYPASLRSFIREGRASTVSFLVEESCIIITG